MISGTIRSGDWKGEKHIPAIEYKKEGELIKVKVQVGKEISHPNTPEHHIAWIEVYFHPEGENFPILIGRTEFANHGDPLTEPIAKFFFRTSKKGKLYALSYCSIHGLWENRLEIE